MRTRKLLLTLTLLLIITTLVYAKKRITKNPEQVANSFVNRMQKDIVLTDSQQLKIKALTIEYINQINGTEENQIKMISMKHKADLDSILTPSQKEQLMLKKKNRIENKNK